MSCSQKKKEEKETERRLTELGPVVDNLEFFLLWKSGY